MKVFFIKQRIFLLILFGIMMGLGFWFSWITRHQAVVAPQIKEVAIVIDDFGGRAKGIQEMMALPYTLNFAVLPFEEFSYQQAEQAMKKGFEIIVHMPFEAFGADPRWYGKKYISAQSTPPEIKKLIDESFQILPMAVGLSNHMSLPLAKRDIFLDNTNSATDMRRQLKKLMEQARTQGMAVGIGHVGQTGVTLAKVLRQELPKYEKEGFHLVPLSELVYTRVPTKFLKNRKIIIGIDPGHGGIDSGTKWGNIFEKNLNLKFSQKLAEELAKRGYRVVLSRDEDRLLTPYAHYTYKNKPYKLNEFRCRIGKMEVANVSAMVSIHANWSKLSYHRGPIAYYSPRSPVSQKNSPAYTGTSESDTTVP